MMEKREKVIADLQEARRILGKVDEPTFGLDYVINAVDDALALLKAQEPVEPVLLREGWNIQHNDYRCPICKNDLNYEQAFCDECGRAMKWE